ncbi:MAG: hypothetical protein K6U80_06250 [Firmicutes bacterium]|nr:hypothetical protein [Bacillota bacterium]
MDIRNCKRCNKIFRSDGSGVCPECSPQEQEDFSKIRDYLFSHPNSSIIDVKLATGIDVKVISRFLKDGRIDSNGIQIPGGETQSSEKSVPGNKGPAAILKNPWQGVKSNKYEHIVKKK